MTVATTCRVTHDGQSILLKVQDQDGTLHTFVLTREQLFGVNADSATILAGKRE